MTAAVSDVTKREGGWYDRLARLRPVFELTPLRITVIYAMFGMAALYVSDVLFVRHLSEPLLSQVQALKGGVEVLLTAGLVFALTARSEAQLRDANTRLEQQRNELQVLHRVLRHNLRNDLTVIKGYAELIQKTVTEAETEYQCETVLEAAEEIEQYTEQAQRIRKASEATNRRRIVDLSEAIPAVLADNSHVTADVEVTMSIPEGTTVEVNPMIEEAIDELVTNAITHNDADAPAITIEVTAEPDPERMMTIHIVDNGPGIPASEMAALRTSEEEPLRHLSGMGLWFVDWVVTHSEGDLEISNAEGGGTEVRIRLPSAETQTDEASVRRLLSAVDAAG